MVNFTRLVFVGPGNTKDAGEWIEIHDDCVLIEPHPDMAEYCRRSFPECTVVESACVGRPGPRTLMHYNNGLSSSVGTLTRQARQCYDYVDWTLEGTTHVAGERLPDILDRLGVDYITSLVIDAQGMDLSILKTMRNWLRAGSIDFIQAESFHPEFRHYDGVPANDFVNHMRFMRRYDYDPERLDTTRLSPNIRWHNRNPKIHVKVNERA